MKRIFIFAMLSIFAMSMATATTILNVDLNQTPLVEETEQFIGLGYVITMNGCNINETSCQLADLNEDGFVDVIDSGIANEILESISSSNGCNMNLTNCSQYDLNNDGLVDVIDSGIAAGQIYDFVISSELGDLYFNVTESEPKWFILENYTFDGTITKDGIVLTVSPTNKSNDTFTLIVYEPDTITVEREVNRCSGGGGTRIVYRDCQDPEYIESLVTVYQNQTVEVPGDCSPQYIEVFQKSYWWGWLIVGFVVGILLSFLVSLSKTPVEEDGNIVREVE